MTPKTKTTSVGRPVTSGVVEGKATRARKDAEWVAQQAGKQSAEVKAAGQAARVAVDPRLASTEVRYLPGGAGGSGGSLNASSWSTVPNAKKAAAKPAETATAPAPSAAPAPTYDPTPLTIGGTSTPAYQPPADTLPPDSRTPELPPQMFAPGGMGAGVDGNAAGFRRKKSSARMAGMTSKGTGQFKITGQSGKSSGLNIGA